MPIYMIGNKKLNHTQKGMTILEIMIALFIFAIAIIIAASIFVNAMIGQRKTQAMQDTLENARYALEAMAKEIRMSHSPVVNLAGDEISVTAIKTGGIGVPIIYSYDSASECITKGAPPVPITSDNIKVTNLKFEINDDYENDPVNNHARVTILMSFQVKDANKPDEGADIVIQTTVSLRN